MPEIDLTDVLLDSSIAGESFSVIRRSSSVGSNGQEVIAEQVIDGLVGSIVPEAGELVREEAFTAGTDAIKVITTFRLRGASKDAAGQNYQADLVVWNGDRYIVRSSNDWSHYGGGFIEADCIQIDWRDTASDEGG